MGHKVVYIEKSEYLKLYLENLKVEVSGKDILIPISDIAILVIDNYRSKLSVPLMNKLTQYNVCTIICGVDHLPQSYLLPMNGHFSMSGNIEKQIQWTKERKTKAHAQIIKYKIHNQIEVLKTFGKDFEIIKRMYEFMDEVVDGDCTNREGLAAKMYFRALFGEDFIRFEEDVVNAGLNYGYSILRSYIASVIVGKGYIANIGIFHRGKQNMFNLADDIIEVFRPVVDAIVYTTMLDDIIFKQEHRERLLQVIHEKMYIDDRKQTLGNAVHLYFDSILHFLHEEKDILFPLPIFHDL